MFFSVGALFGRAAAIDLGTVNTVVAIEGRGIVLNEPTAAAVYTEAQRERGIISSGADAERLYGRTPGGVNIIYPMKDGVIADISAVGDMLGDFFIKAFGRRRGAFSTADDNQLELYYLPSGFDLVPGDRIVTSGMSSIFPKSIVVGTVSEVTRRSAEGTQSNAIIEPAVDFGHLEEVLVLIEKTGEE